MQVVVYVYSREDKPYSINETSSVLKKLSFFKKKNSWFVLRFDIFCRRTGTYTLQNYSRSEWPNKLYSLLLQKYCM